MTRKLAVTVFAMSLTLVGCGSSSTTKVDAGKDAKPAPDVGAVDVVKLDVVGPIGIDTRPADVTTLPPDAGVDTGIITPVDAVGDTAPADVVSVPPDGGVKDTGPVPLDTIPADTAKPDGGGAADVQPIQPDGPPANVEVGPIGTLDAAADAALDAPPSVTPDAPNAGNDVPPSVTPDAAEDAASDVPPSVTPDAAEDAASDVTPSVTPDAEADVATAVDAAEEEVEVDAGNIAADGGGGDALTD